MSIQKHSLIYFLGRLIPGLINFSALAIYSRILTPEEYGIYALAFSTILLLNTIFYQWIRVSLLRLLPSCKNESEKRDLSAYLSVGFVISSFFALIAALCIYLFLYENMKFSKIIIPSLLLLWVYGIFEIGLEFLRSNLKPKSYVFSYNLKSIIALLAGVSFCYLNLGAVGLIYGLLVAILITILTNFNDFIKFFFYDLKRFKWSGFKSILSYGLPFTLTFGMTFIFNFSDRFFINYYLDENATGIYSIGYDFARQSLWVLFTSINLAAFPLAIRTFEKEGEAAAKDKFRSNLILLLLVLVPATSLLMGFAKPLSFIILGAKFSESVAQIIPLISFGTLFLGLKNFYFDQSFQISKKTSLQIVPVVAAAIINIIGNILFIPYFGIMGAVYSALASFFIALVSGIIITNKTFKMPFPKKEVLKIFLSGLILYGLILILNSQIELHIFSLVLASIIFLSIYMILLNFMKITEVKIIVNNLVNIFRGK
jgi:O-antigen/teichoic acid export membrane protein